MIRILALASGIATAMGASQFPEYSQQYMQRLSGAVQELSNVVADFDADAAALQLTRQEALDDLSKGSTIGEARALSMSRVFKRHARLSEDLDQLTGRTVLERAFTPWRFTEATLARETFDVFRPAMPLTTEGIGFAAMGLAVGYAWIVVLFAGLGRFFRRKNATGRNPQIT